MHRPFPSLSLVPASPPRPTARIQHIVALALLLGAAGFDGAVAQPGSRPGTSPLRVSTSTAAASHLPPPHMAPGEQPRTCPGTARAVIRTPEPRYESEEARAALQQFARLTLFAWGDMHLRYPNGACVDPDYLVGKFQEATGSAITGVLSMANVQRLNQALEAGRNDIRQAESNADTFETRSAVDFLPYGGTNPQRLQAGSSRPMRCDQRAAEIRKQRRQGSGGLLGALGVIQGVKAAQANPVAPEWAAYWPTRPLLTQWAEESGCVRDLQVMVEHWQATIGAPVSASDPQAIGRTEEWLNKAQSDLAAFSSQQRQQLSKDAASATQASGEAARARVWALDALDGNTRLSDLADNIPSALCQIQDSEVTCAGAVAACVAETAALREANAAVRRASSTHPPGSSSYQSQQELTTLRQRQAEHNLARCNASVPHSAAANSRITFAGQRVQTAQLTFDAQGLSTMRFTIAGNAEPARMLLTRRHRNVETQQEVRTRTETVMEPGGSEYVPGVGMVQTGPEVEHVPVSYSVTRYIWTAPGVRVEESTGDFLFRFFQAAPKRTKAGSK